MDDEAWLFIFKRHMNDPVLMEMFLANYDDNDKKEKILTFNDVFLITMSACSNNDPITNTFKQLLCNLIKQNVLYNVANDEELQEGVNVLTTLMTPKSFQ